ncbi:hypothetical protein [Janibacter terrae]|uniref:hypothetical protein n=1 Tax=Janibacter terrae TaxID=103817 RepID=UPI0031F7C711
MDPALWDRLSDTEITRRVDAVQARLLEAEQQAAQPETDQPPEPPRAVAVRSDGADRRGEFAVHFPRGEYPRGVEMLAVVREHADGEAYVDYQVAAGDPMARGQIGLHLQARRAAGSPPRTDVKLTAEQYARLQAAAGSNRVEVRGVSVLAVRGDLTVTRSGGYTLSLRSVGPSRRGTISTDVLDRQRAVEDKARASRQEHVRQQSAIAAETVEHECDRDQPDEGDKGR